MPCNFVTVYDSPQCTNQLSVSNIVFGQEIYFKLDPDEGYYFKEWVDRYGKPISENIIKLVDPQEHPGISLDVYETIFQCNDITAVFLSEINNPQNTRPDWINIYDSPIGGNKLNPDNIELDQSNKVRLYIDISQIPQDLKFVKWQKFEENAWVDMTSTEITLLKGGRYATALNCGMSVAAYVAEKTEQACSLSLDVYPSGSGTITASPDSNYSCGDSVEITATPSDCYKFAYWDDGSEDSGLQTRTVTVSGVNMMYTAYFEPNEYDINVATSNRLHGSVEGPSRPVKCGDTFQIKAIPKGGYEFVRWDDNNTNEIREITFESNISTTYVAYFQRLDTYYVIYNNNFSPTDEINQGPFLPDTEYTFQYLALPPEFARAGYNFLGWSEDSTSQTADVLPGEIEENEVFTDTKTMYAIWEEKVAYELAYYDSDGNPILDQNESPYTERYYDGDVVTLLQYSDIGFGPSQFLGWQITDDSSPISDNDTDSIPAYMGNIIFDHNKRYAHAKMAKDGMDYITITYNFNLNYPYSNISTQICGIISGSRIDVLDPASFGVDYSSCNFSFRGWSMLSPQSNIVVELPKSMEFYSDTAFIAIVEEREKALLSLKNNCKSDENNITVFKGDNFKFDCTDYECEGYRLLGWSKNKEGVFPEYECNTYMYVDSDMELYTIWVQNTVYVNYNYCDGVTQQMSYTIGDDVTISDYRNCELNGCSASGWLDVYTNTIYENNDTVQDITQDMELYLQYGDCCPVTFYSMNGADIMVNGTVLRGDGNVVNIDDNTVITILPNRGLELGCFDMTNMSYLSPCDEPSSYTYVFVPSETGINNSRVKITILSNSDFISAIDNPSNYNYEFIKNQSTGEICQKVGVCEGGSVAYDFECEHKMMAVVVRWKYTQTNGGAGYHAYDTTSYRTIYDYMSANTNTLYTNEDKIIVTINNTPYYYEVTR